MLFYVRALMNRMQYMLRVVQSSFQLHSSLHLPQTPPPLLPVSKSHKHWSMGLNRKAQKKDNSWESEKLWRQNRTEKFYQEKMVVNSKMTLMECRGVKWIMVCTEGQQTHNILYNMLLYRLIVLLISNPYHRLMLIRNLRKKHVLSINYEFQVFREGNLKLRKRIFA